MFIKNWFKSKKKVDRENVAVLAPIAGKVVSLESLKDGVFSEKMMGDGIAIIPEKIGKKVIFKSPMSGNLETVFPTGHAFGIRDKNNFAILIHIGIDTVNLDGKGFELKVKQGQDVIVGTPLVEVDLEYVQKHAPSIATIIVQTPDSSGKITDLLKDDEVKSDGLIFSIK